MTRIAVGGLSIVIIDVIIVTKVIKEATIYRTLSCILLEPAAILLGRGCCYCHCRRGICVLEELRSRPRAEG